MVHTPIPSHRQAGFSIVEMMIGLVIGMIAIIVMMQVFSVSEGYKRTTTGGDDAQNTFAIAVAVAASNSFLTPIGYQTNTMVYGPGGYRFGDYLRLGLPLTIASVVLTVLIVARGL